ncbi:hypothetical protein [Kitasatospora sp. NPDC086791]|uniref:hypothetical protein n=1 Tax=Kitasatospora sp. NPDC086791 TaxID=3155178 RepID=UPI003428EB1F
MTLDPPPDHVGGLPSFPSGRAEVPAPWRYFFPLGLASASDEDEDEDEDDPYVLDLDDGDGFGFLSPDGSEGRVFCEIP